MEVGDMLGYVFYIIDAIGVRNIILVSALITLAAGMLRQMRQ